MATISEREQQVINWATQEIDSNIKLGDKIVEILETDVSEIKSSMDAALESYIILSAGNDQEIITFSKGYSSIVFDFYLDNPIENYIVIGIQSNNNVNGFILKGGETHISCIASFINESESIIIKISNDVEISYSWEAQLYFETFPYVEHSKTDHSVIRGVPSLSDFSIETGSLETTNDFVEVLSDYITTPYQYNIIIYKIYNLGENDLYYQYLVSNSGSAWEINNANYLTAGQNLVLILPGVYNIYKLEIKSFGLDISTTYNVVLEAYGSSFPQTVHDAEDHSGIPGIPEPEIFTSIVHSETSHLGLPGISTYDPYNAVNNIPDSEEETTPTVAEFNALLTALKGSGLMIADA